MKTFKTRIFKEKILGICRLNPNFQQMEIIWEGYDMCEANKGIVLEVLVGGEWIEAALLQDEKYNWYWFTLVGGWKIYLPDPSNRTITVRMNEKDWPGKLIIEDPNAESELGWRFAENWEDYYDHVIAVKGADD